MSRVSVAFHLLGFLLVSALFLLLVMLVAIIIGETYIPVTEVFKTVANHLLGTEFFVPAIDQGIIWSYRLARAVVAACCGAILAISGVVLQALLRNPLADPYILGISAGASTGAVCSVILGIGSGLFSMPISAFIGAQLAFGLVNLLSTRAGGGAGAVILSGVAVAQLFNALTSLIVTKAASAEQARGVMFWLLGSLSGVRWADVWLLLPCTLLVLGTCLWNARALDAFRFGERQALSLGIQVWSIRGILIGVCTLSTAVVVSIVGSIGFIGLVIPHAMRMTISIRHGYLLPATALGGAIFMIVADILSRIVIPGQVLPIGVITALFGAPAFALLLSRKGSKP